MLRQAFPLRTNGTKSPRMSFQFELASELVARVGESTEGWITFCAHFALAADAISAYCARINPQTPNWRQTA
jgi:hypothetical protein